MNLRAEIEAALQPLVGEPLSGVSWMPPYERLTGGTPTGREPFGRMRFEFGVPRLTRNQKGEEIRRADWALVVSCWWDIENGDGYPLLSTIDFAPERDPRFNRTRLFYGMAQDLYNPMRGMRVAVRKTGAVDFKLSQDVELAIFATEGAAGTERELWRLITRDQGVADFVVRADDFDGMNE